MGRRHLSALDVAVSARELNAMIGGSRINNIYDLGPRTYLFKFSRPNKKTFLLVESGVRYHVTEFERDTGPAPNAFAAKLRKHLKNRRVEGFRQLGIDRVLHMMIGAGPTASHLFIELFSGGNIILCDNSLMVVTLLRSETSGRVAVRERYPIEEAKPSPENPTIELLHDVMAKMSSPAGAEQSAAPTNMQIALALRWPKQLISEAFSLHNISPSSACTKESADRLLVALQGAAGVYEQVCDAASLCAPTAAAAAANDDGDEAAAAAPRHGGFVINDAAGKPVEFTPLLLQEHSGKSYSRFPTFNAAMDHFFSSFESIKKVQQSVKAEREVISKEERLRRELHQRSNKLGSQIERSAHLASLIEVHHELVDNAIDAMTAEIARGMDWSELQRMLEDERRRHNFMAERIVSLDLVKNSMTMVLDDPDFESEGQKQSQARVDINLGLSAHANAGLYYDQRRKAMHKLGKTNAAASGALQSAAKRSQKDLSKLKRQRGKDGLSVRRKICWFEKFHWFITSDNYLVIGGRDAQQNETVVRRHLGPNDLYFHADIHGASSIVLKNPSGRKIPDRSLTEAACMTICRSAAWSSKAIVSAYWVNAHQVSKSAPSGQYLSTGSFMIRGKKNFVPPSAHVMGLGILFRLEDSCIAAHANESSVPVLSDDVAEAEPTVDKTVSAQPQNPPVLISSRDVTASQVRAEPVRPAQALKPAPETVSDSSDDLGFDVTSSLILSDAAAQGDAVQGDSVSKLEQSDELVNTSMFGFESSAARSAQKSSVKSAAENQRPARLSKWQRRNLKKTGDINVAPELPEQIKESPSTASQPSSSQKLVPELPRGKRSKMKRMQRKYADQDEEERQLRAKLLGTTLPTVCSADMNSADAEPSDSESEKKSNSEPVEPDTVITDDWIVKRCFHCHESGHVVRECPLLQGLDKSELNRAIQAGQDLRRQEDGVLKKDAARDDELSDLASLTGRPFPDDILLAAVPMCAPFSSLSQFHFKVKLTPGSLKRGQASRIALSALLKAEECTDRIRDLLLAMSDADLTSVLMADLKVSGVGVPEKTKSKGKRPSKPVKRNKGSKRI